MGRTLEQLRYIKDFYACPLVLAGDLFHKWNSPPRLVNWALEHLPHLYSIVGQHDLPNHSYDLLKDSAYYTLMRAGQITNLAPGEVRGVESLILHAFPWGSELKPCEESQKHTFAVNVAVVHRYIWTNTTGHVGANEKDHLWELKSLRKGKNYGLMHFGDNHVSFLSDRLPEETIVLNPGSLMVRNRDQRAHCPFVGLLHRDETLSVQYLDCSEDKMLALDDLQQEEAQALDMAEFFQELTDRKGVAPDFPEALRHYLEHNRVRKEVVEIALTALEGK